ncbi:vWA domain-containing protein [Rhodococcus sp. 27YEA15]|uniref:vWA domain-containing protein n=1 Tax=Rhodococcus sp. 27YEA15 TaxID=3156259 RepID=UPI003C7C6C72
MTVAALALCIGIQAILMLQPAAADPIGNSTTETNAKLVLTLDASGSMLERDAGGQTRIAAARSALGTVIDGLAANQQVGLRVFGATVSDGSSPDACTDSQLLVPIAGDNRAQLKTAAGSYEPLGQTPIGYALRQATDDLGSSGQRSILLVSDGESTCAPEPCEVARELSLQGIDLMINVVGLNVDGAAREQLQCIARSGNGSYFDAQDTDSLVQVLSAMTVRAFEPFAITGQPVTGTPTRNGAPTLSDGGQYTDTLRAGEEIVHYLLTRKTPGSSLHVGFTALPSTKVYGQAGLHLETLSGKSCAWDYPMGTPGGSWSLLSGALVAWSLDPSNNCVADDQLVLTVETTKWGDGAAGTPFELLVTEEPPLAPGQTLPDKVTDAQNWTSTSPDDGANGSVRAGSSANAPTPLAPGSYTGNVLPGEQQFFGVDLDWGQELRVNTRLDPLDPRAKQPSAATSTNVRLNVVSPMRGAAVPNLVGSRSPQAAVTVNGGKVATIGTPPVRWMNRDDITGGRTYLPGRYIVTLAADAVEDTFEIPYTLTVEVVGRAGEGAPQYIAGATGTGAPSDTPNTAARSAGTTEAAAEDSASKPRWALIGGLALGGVILLGAGAWGLLSRRHTNR